MPTDSRPRHILAINDESTILAIYRELLCDEGYLVTAELMPYVDIADVLAVAPDLIVLDLLVGHQDSGTAFLRLLKNHPATDHLPVLVCSAATDHLKELEDELREWDCTVVTKPFDIDVFLGAVASCLGTKPSGVDKSAA